MHHEKHFKKSSGGNRRAAACGMAMRSMALPDGKALSFGQGSRRGAIKSGIRNGYAAHKIKSAAIII